MLYESATAIMKTFQTASLASFYKRNEKKNISEEFSVLCFFFNLAAATFATQSCIRIFPPARKENLSRYVSEEEKLLSLYVFARFFMKRKIVERAKKKGEGCAIDFRLEPIISL